MPEEIRIFSSFHEAEKALPDKKPKKLIINGRALCIVRLAGEIFVTDNICPHNKASLSGGWVNAYRELICPLHQYRYDLNTGRESASRCEDLETFKVRIDEKGVFLVL